MTGMDEIYSRFSGMVYTYLMRLCGNDELAQELTQETFCQAIQSIRHFDGKSSVGTWLCSIARHLFYDFLRRRKTSEPLRDEHPSEEDFTDQLVRRDQAMIAYRTEQRFQVPKKWL